MPQMPEPGDLVVGPLVIISGKAVANADPAGFGEHVPLEVRVGGRARVQRVTLSLFAGSCAA